MRTRSVYAPRLDVSLGTARLEMLLVYPRLQENQQAQEYGSRSHCSLRHYCPRTISIPAR